MGGRSAFVWRSCVETTQLHLRYVPHVLGTSAGPSNFRISIIFFKKSVRLLLRLFLRLLLHLYLSIDSRRPLALLSTLWVFSPCLTSTMWRTGVPCFTSFCSKTGLLPSFSMQPETMQLHGPSGRNKIEATNPNASHVKHFRETRHMNRVLYTYPRLPYQCTVDRGICINHMQKDGVQSVECKV